MFSVLFRLPHPVTNLDLKIFTYYVISFLEPSLDVNKRTQLYQRFYYFQALDHSFCLLRRWSTSPSLSLISPAATAFNLATDGGKYLHHLMKPATSGPFLMKSLAYLESSNSFHLRSFRRLPALPVHPSINTKPHNKGKNGSNPARISFALCPPLKPNPTTFHEVLELNKTKRTNHQARFFFGKRLS